MSKSVLRGLPNLESRCQPDLYIANLNLIDHRGNAGHHSGSLSDRR